MGAKRATMRDVAAASGVSPATVSFVLNGVANQTISPATRERVERAARNLAYVPHGIAKALREGSSRIVLLTLDPAFGGAGSEDYIRGLDTELTQHGYVLLVRHGPTSRASLAAMVDTVSPKAVIDLAAIYTSGAPTADDGGWVNGLPAHTAVQLRHLAESGHTGVAVASPDDDALARLAGVRLASAREAAPALGLDPVESLTVPGDVPGTVTALREFLAAHPRITAIAAFDDRVALRILAALTELGRHVPQDIAVIGFNDTEHGAVATPPLTSVHIDAESFGRLAARRALGLAVADVVPAPARIIRRASA
ncbi:LacI family DNA-binding transcriptional regulator [Cryobacterium sp. AP23]